MPTFVVAPSALSPRRRQLAARTAILLASSQRMINFFTVDEGTTSSCRAIADVLAHRDVRVYTSEQERVAELVLQHVQMWIRQQCSKRTMTPLHIIVFDDEGCTDRIIRELALYCEYIRLTVVLARGRPPRFFRKFQNVQLLVPTVSAHITLLFKCVFRGNLNALVRARRYPYFATANGKGARHVIASLPTCV